MRKKAVKIMRCAAAFIIMLALVCLPLNLKAMADDDKHDIRTIKISAVGDCTLGKNYKSTYKNSWGYMYSKKGSGYFLKKVSKYFKKDDLTIANLEGVLSSSGKRLKKYYDDHEGMNEVKDYSHLGKPKYLKALKKGGVDVVTFANNHNIDYGLKGFKNTLKACKKYNMPVAYYDNVVRYKVNGLTVGIISIDATNCSTKRAKKYLKAGMADLNSDCDLIIACMHWGENYKKKPDKEQQELGHLCVDLGADMVVGAHAHILQGVERYKGRYIYYSLGNFSYGGRKKPKDADTMIVQQTFTFVDGTLQIDDNVKILPCWMSTSKKKNTYQPVVKKGSAARKIIKKLNKRSKQFSVKFGNNGRPEMEAASDTFIKEPKVSASGNKPKKIPDAIYIQLKKMDP